MIRPQGWVLANPEDMKAFAARLIAGDSVRIVGEVPWLDLPSLASAALEITATYEDREGSSAHLVYHPKVLTLGVGGERGVGADELLALVDETLNRHRLSRQALTAIASIDVKEDESAIHMLAQHLGLPLRVFTASDLNEQAPKLKSPSAVVMSEVGCPGVAEGAALAAAGPDARLIVAKTKSKHATCAVALAPAPIVELRGRAQGRISLVGLGPGDRGSRSPAASAAMRRATDWVGYGLYLDLARGSQGPAAGTPLSPWR